MIADIKSLLSGTFDRLRKPRLSMGFWGLAVLSTICLPLLTPIVDALPEDSWDMVPGVVLILAAVIWIFFFVYWKLTRSVADFEDRKGAFWPWVGWGLLALVPVIAVMIGFLVAEDGEDSLYVEALALTFLPPLSAPLFIHATGRAIDATGPRASEVLAYWKPRYWVLVTAYLLVTAPATLLSELLYIFAVGENMLLEIAASLISLPAIILGTVLTVEAFHRIPDVRQP